MPKQPPSDRPHDDAPVATAKDAQPARKLIAASVTINRSRAEVYGRLRHAAQLASFAEYDVDIEALDDRRSRWRVLTHEGKCYEWTAIITDEVEGESVTWQTEVGTDFLHSGQAQLEDASGRGCVLTLHVAFEPAAGLLDKLKARLVSLDPAVVLRTSLVRFKQHLETGEIATGARRPDMVKNRSEERI